MSEDEKQPATSGQPKYLAGKEYSSKRRRRLKKAAALGTGTGKVKWFDQTKGYGFIVPDDGGKDLFVHITAVQHAGYTSLVPGARVSYEIRRDREGNPTAEDLRFGGSAGQDHTP